MPPLPIAPTVPASQLVQTSIEVAPTTLLCFPTGQGTHAMADEEPSRALNFPASHGVHSITARSLYVPFLHSAHVYGPEIARSVPQPHLRAANPPDEATTWDTMLDSSVLTAVEDPPSEVEPHVMTRLLVVRAAKAPEVGTMSEVAPLNAFSTDGAMYVRELYPQDTTSPLDFSAEKPQFPTGSMYATSAASLLDTDEHDVVDTYMQDPPPRDMSPHVTTPPPCLTAANTDEWE